MRKRKNKLNWFEKLFLLPHHKKKFPLKGAWWIFSYKWTSIEDRALKIFAKAGMTTGEIARRLERSYHAVNNRLYKLRKEREEIYKDIGRQLLEDRI